MPFYVSDMMSLNNPNPPSAMSFLLDLLPNPKFIRILLTSLLIVAVIELLFRLKNQD